MPYKDPAKRAEAQQRYRDNAKGITNGIAEEGITPEGVSRVVIPKHSVYQCIMSSGGRITPTLLDALTDSEKRKKLTLICDSLSKRNLQSRVYYGISGITFTDIDQLLETTS